MVSLITYIINAFPTVIFICICHLHDHHHQQYYFLFLIHPPCTCTILTRVDIYNRLTRERIVFMGSEIDDEMANQIIGVLLVRELYCINQSFFRGVLQMR